MKMDLLQHLMNLKNIKGTTNVIADSLSRLAIINDNSETMITETCDCFVNRNLFIPNEKCPIKFQEIQDHQNSNKSSIHDSVKTFHGINLKLHNNKIYIPDSLKHQLITFYHEFLLHPGINRMIATISQHYSWPAMTNDIKHLCLTCKHCQQNKNNRT